MLAAYVAKAVKPLPVIQRQGVVLLRSTHALIQALTLPQSPPRSLVAHASKPARSWRWEGRSAPEATET
jgi:hypothetical protein